MKVSKFETRIQTLQAILPLFSAWENAWKRLLKNLMNGDELRIWKASDCHGNTSWQAYDPATGHSTTFGSEADIRAWIEERYYH